MSRSNCKNCGEPWIAHYGRSENCPYVRHGDFDYRAKGLAWPERQTWYEPSVEALNKRER